MEQAAREDAYGQLKTSLEEVVADAIEGKFEENGHLSATSVSSILENYHQKAIQHFNSKVDELKACVGVTTFMPDETIY